MRFVYLFLSILLALNQQIRGVVMDNFAGLSPSWGFLPLLVLTLVAFYKKVLTLEENQKPKMKIIFNEGKEPYEFRDHTSREFRIGLKNTGGIALRNCKVRLEEMTMEKGLGSFLPMQLQVLDEASAEFHLSLGEEKHIRIAALMEAEANSEIILFYKERKPNTLKRANYGLRIAAYSDESTPVEEDFSLLVDEDGQLRFHRE